MEISDSETILVIGSIGGATEEKRQERGIGGKLRLFGISRYSQLIDL